MPHPQQVEEATIQALREKLRRLRKVYDFTQEDVADLAKIDYKFYQSVEAGRRKELRVSTLERIAHAFGLKAYHLLIPKLPSRSLMAVMSESKSKYLAARSTHKRNPK